MTADSEGSGDPAGQAPAGDAPATPAADESAAAADDLKAKYREALAHKQGSHGATNVQHGDKGAGPHGSDSAHGHRMFRRKSGG